MVGMSGNSAVWRCGQNELAIGHRTLVMGIVNVTPDSFSDGGIFEGPEDALKHSLQLLADGADILDVGGESTRPGGDTVPDAAEIARVVPVIERIRAEAPEAIVSVDTRKPVVAREALAAGACIVNDVAAATDAGMLDVVRETDAGLVLMHMRGDPKTMQANPHYDDVVGEVRSFLASRIEAATAAGLDPSRLCVDPGIGFGKNLRHNLDLLRSIGSFRDLGAPALVGVSRKRFIGELTGVEDPADRVDGTAGAVAWCAAQRVDVVRVHDVRRMTRVVRVVDAIVRGSA
jgi:dihydropteroate synthase